MASDYVIRGAPEIERQPGLHPPGAVLYVRVPRETKAEADRVCRERGVSLTKLVSHALEVYLEGLGWQHTHAEVLP